MIHQIVYFGLCMIAVHAISNGANEPIADNQLGLTAKDCALQFCEEKDGMALWMTLVQQCNEMHTNPYFKEEFHKNGPICFQQENKDFIITPGVSGMMCSMMSFIGLIMGYSFAEKWNGKKDTIQYQELATKDTD